MRRPDEAATRVLSARRIAAVGYPVAGLAVFLALWWGATRLLVEPGSFLSQFAPVPAFESLAAMLQKGALNRHIYASVERITVGLLIASAVGIPLGLALGGLRWFALAATPITGFVRMISPLSWTPLAIILFGVGDPPVYFLIAIGSVWPIALSTAAGVQALDRAWIMLARSLRASRVETVRTVIWPGVRPDVLTGLRIGTTTAWIILVPAEMLGVDSGLGFFILDARDRFDYPGMVAAIILIGAIGLVIDRLTSWLLTPRRRARTSRVAEPQPVPAPLPADYRI